MKKLDIKINRINDEFSVWYITHQDEEIFKRGNFFDKELNTHSNVYPSFNPADNELSLKGYEVSKDFEPVPIKNSDIKKLIKKVNEVNKKYGNEVE